MRKKDQKNLVKVGAFVTGLVLILMIMIVSIGKETSLFEPKVDIRARVPNVSNLKTGSYVELKGIRIGTVAGISIVSEEEVEINMTVLEDSLKWIKKDSKVSIATAGLVGDKYVEIFNGTKEAGQFKPHKDVLVSEKITDLKSIMTKGESITATTDRILLRLDSILAKIDEGNLIVSSLQSINRAGANLERVSSELREAQVGMMV
ncbi:MAG: MlaD family protein, partial [Bacteriovoracia bacterium]